MVMGLCWAGGGARGGRRAQGGSGLGQMLGLKNEQRPRSLPSLAQTHECTSTRKFPGWGFVRAARMGMSPCTPARAPQHQGNPCAPLHVQTSTTNPPLHVQIPPVHPSTEDAPISMSPQHQGTSPCPPTRVPKHLHGVGGCWARLEAEPPPGPASHPFCRIGALCQEPDLWVRGRGPRPAPGTGPSLELTLSLRGRILGPLHPSGTRGGCNPAREPSSITLPSSFPN